MVAAALAVVIFGVAGAPGAAASVGPVASAGPSVIGTAAAGKLLTGLSGTWAGFGQIAYRFQWYRCNAAGAKCSAVGGATSPSYKLGDRDVGRTVGLAVRATDTTGAATAYSSLVGPIATRRPLLETTAQPVVTGPPVQGKTVQVTTGTWSPVPARSSPTGGSVATRTGATAPPSPTPRGTSYAITAADVGHAILAVVKASNGTTIQNAFSTATPGGRRPPSVKGPTGVTEPSITGLAVVGQQLQARAGIWRGAGRRPSPTAGTGATRTVRAAPWRRAALERLQPCRDGHGATIGLTLKLSDAVGASRSTASLLGPVAAAGADLMPTSLPTISGTARVGGALNVEWGVWTAKPSGYATTWLRCNANGRFCTPIAGRPGRRTSRRRTTRDTRSSRL